MPRLNGGTPGLFIHSLGTGLARVPGNTQTKLNSSSFLLETSPGVRLDPPVQVNHQPLLEFCVA